METNINPISQMKKQAHKDSGSPSQVQSKDWNSGCSDSKEALYSSQFSEHIFCQDAELLFVCTFKYTPLSNKSTLQHPFIHSLATEHRLCTMIVQVTDDPPGQPDSSKAILAPGCRNRVREARGPCNWHEYFMTVCSFLRPNLHLFSHVVPSLAVLRVSN